MSSRSRVTRSRSHSQEPEDEAPRGTTKTRTRTGAGGNTRRTTRNSSIAETELENSTDTGEEEETHESSSSGGEDQPASASSSQYQQPAAASSYSFATLNRAIRSPYRTRSTSKSRGQEAKYTRTTSGAAAAGRIATPTKALSFVEGDEDADVDSPPRARTNLREPQTPSQQEAHEDADVYMQDCCDSHEVILPDGTTERRHSHGPGHSHRPSRPYPISRSPSYYDDLDLSPSSSPRSAKPRTIPHLIWYILLSLIMVSLLGPWALKQITNRPPSFVGEPGKGVITQADLDRIIDHVILTMRSDLLSAKYVDEPRLAEATTDLSTRLIQERNAHVKRAVSEALSLVQTKLDAALQEEDMKDEAALKRLRTELVDLINSHVTASLNEWSSKLLIQFQNELAESDEVQKKNLQSLLNELTTLRSTEKDARSTLQKDILQQVDSLFQKEQVEDTETMKELEKKLDGLFKEQKEKDAVSLKEQFKQERDGLNTLLTTRLSNELGELEEKLRKKVLEEAAESFAPLSAVLSQAGSDNTGSNENNNNKLQEDLLLQRLKSHLSTLLADLPKPPAPIDESALESRIVEKLETPLNSQNLRLEKLQSELKKVEDNIVALETLTKQVEEVAQNAEIVAKSRPVPTSDGDAPAAAVDYSPEILSLNKQLKEVHTTLSTLGKTTSSDLEGVNQQLDQLKTDMKTQQDQKKDYTPELTKLQTQVDGLLALPDLTSSLDTLQEKLKEVVEQQKQHAENVAAVKSDVEKNTLSIQILADKPDAPAGVTVQQFEDLNTQIEELRKNLASLAESSKASSSSSSSSEPQIEQKDYSKDIAALNEKVEQLTASAGDNKKDNKDSASAAEVLALQDELTALRAELARLQEDAKEMNQRLEDTNQAVVALPKAGDSSSSSGASSDLDSVRHEISTALEKYSADRTGLVDYALRTSGGRILAHSPSHQVPLEGSWLLGLIKKCLLTVRKPEEILTENMSVGSCWPMDGTAGYVTIGLREKILPSSVSIQHISSTIAPDYTTTPKEFSVWALEDSDYSKLRSHTNSVPVGTMLGRFTYVANSTQLQTFELNLSQQQQQKSYSMLTVGFHSNYGNPSYTCIYRVRVHGRSMKKEIGM